MLWNRRRSTWTGPAGTGLWERPCFPFSLLAAWSGCAAQVWRRKGCVGGRERPAGRVCPAAVPGDERHLLGCGVARTRRAVRYAGPGTCAWRQLRAGVLLLSLLLLLLLHLR